MKNIRYFYLKNFFFFFLVVVKFSIYLNRLFFVMNRFIEQHPTILCVDDEGSDKTFVTSCLLSCTSNAS